MYQKKKPRQKKRKESSAKKVPTPRRAKRQTALLIPLSRQTRFLLCHGRQAVAYTLAILRGHGRELSPASRVMDVRLTQTQPQQQFRLLELPPELLELLESENPPEYVQTGLSLLSRTQADRHRLSLKSSTPSTSPSTSTSDFVNLCTPTKTFLLRQVNSSNSILLIKPQGEEESITSIAQCKSTLEVQAMDANTSTNSALLPLLAALPIYDESDIRIDERTEDDDHPLPVAEVMQERLKVFADIPFSVVECERAWTDICAFVYKNKESGAIGCHRPSARAKLMAWEKMVEGATLHGIDLGRQFLVDDLWSAVIEEAEHTVIDEYPFPRSLFDAIVRRLVDDSPDIDRVLKCMFFLCCWQWYFSANEHSRGKF